MDKWLKNGLLKKTASNIGNYSIRTLLTNENEGISDGLMREELCINVKS